MKSIEDTYYEESLKIIFGYYLENCYDETGKMSEDEQVRRLLKDLRKFNRNEIFEFENYDNELSIELAKEICMIHTGNYDNKNFLDLHVECAKRFIKERDKAAKEIDYLIDKKNIDDEYCKMLKAKGY